MEEAGHASEAEIRARAEAIHTEQLRAIHQQTDRLFGVLLMFQWAFAIVIAVLFSPYGWEGKVRAVHQHVYAAVFIGALINSLPLALILRRPGWAVTRHVVAIAQMLWSALLIHLTGGRIETHFHVFGSLAFLAFYRDWRVLVPATLVVVVDHLARGMFWPESVYGVVSPEWWRFLEHAFWVAFEDIVLVLACVRGVAEMRETAERQARLDAAHVQLKEAHEKRRKLAAVGELAASVGHELRNPLAAVRNAATYVSKRLSDPEKFASAATDGRIPQFLAVIEHEVQVSAKIISDLLDFARERTPELRPCPLRPLAREAINLVVRPERVQIVNEITEEIPIPNLDWEQFRQVLVNLVQNGVDAIPDAHPGEVKVAASIDSERRVSITVTDNGAGMPADVTAKVFEPLFTTKTKGTGLGLAIVSNLVELHRATIHVDSEVGRGTSFVIQLPAA